MGHGTGAAAAVDHQSAACRVLPAIQEEPSDGEVPPEMTTARMAERRRAIVSRMRELLARAAAAQSARSRLRRSTVATAKKWKRVVRRIHNRGAAGGATSNEQHRLQAEDGMLSSSSSVSSKSSFSWDAGATESCCSSALSPANGSPLLWPAFLSSAHHQPGTTAADQRVPSSPATSVARLSCGSSWSEDDDNTRMAHWVTTDSDFLVLEL